MFGIKMRYLFYTLLLLSVALLLFMGFSSTQPQNDAVLCDDALRFHKGWKLVNQTNKVESAVTLPLSLAQIKNANRSGVFKNTIPTVLSEDSYFAFSTKNASVLVYIDSELVYDSMLTKPFQFKNSQTGTVWHFFPIPKEAQSKEITLQLNTTQKLLAGNIYEILIGTKTSCFYYIRLANLLNVIACLFLLFLGVILFLVYFMVRRKSKLNLSIFYLSSFSFLMALWSLTETGLLPLFFHHFIFLAYLPYFALMLVPIPFLLFIKMLYAQSYAFYINSLCKVAVLNYVLCTLLHLFHIADFSQTRLLTLCLLILCAIFAIAVAFIEAFHKSQLTARPFAYCMILIVISLGIDFVRHMMHFSNSGLFFRMALLIFIIVPSIDTVKKHYMLKNIANESHQLKQLAYTDILTQKPNRTAFNSEIKTLEFEENTQDITLIVFDVNNLKTVNDTFGHFFGDAIIVEASNVIQEAFEPFGTCYRIGGDEFAQILSNISAQELNNRFALLSTHLSLFNQNHEYQLEIAYGHAHFSHGDRNLTDTFVRADMMMYLNKKAMKEDAQLCLFDH